MSAIPQNLRFSPISIRTVKLYRQGPWDKYCEYLNTREICWDVAIASPSKVLCFFFLLFLSQLEAQFAVVSPPLSQKGNFNDLAHSTCVQSLRGLGEKLPTRKKRGGNIPVSAYSPLSFGWYVDHTSSWARPRAEAPSFQYGTSSHVDALVAFSRMVIHDEGLILGLTLPNILSRGRSYRIDLIADLPRPKKTKHMKRELSGHIEG